MDSARPWTLVHDRVCELGRVRPVLATVRAGPDVRGCTGRSAGTPVGSGHLKVFAQPCPDGRLFVGPQGGIPKRRNVNRVWKKALKAAQVNPDLHLHDLRHTGATLA